MECVLIVNVDDFGFSKGQNYGIIEVCCNGVVILIIVLVNGVVIDYVVQLSCSILELVVGMYFVLMLGELLLVMLGLICDGWLGKWIWQQVEEDILLLEEIVYELVCQYCCFVEFFGYELMYIDSYYYVYMFVQIYFIVVVFVCEKGIVLCIDCQVVVQSGFDQQVVCSSVGFSSEFYGEVVFEELFLQMLDVFIVCGECFLEVMCYLVYVDWIIMGSVYCYL